MRKCNRTIVHLHSFWNLLKIRGASLKAGNAYIGSKMGIADGTARQREDSDSLANFIISV